MRWDDVYYFVQGVYELDTTAWVSSSSDADALSAAEQYSKADELRSGSSMRMRTTTSTRPKTLAFTRCFATGSRSHTSIGRPTLTLIAQVPRPLSKCGRARTLGVPGSGLARTSPLWVRGVRSWMDSCSGPRPRDFEHRRDASRVRSFRAVGAASRLVARRTRRATGLLPGEERLPEQGELTRMLAWQLEHRRLQLQERLESINSSKRVRKRISQPGYSPDRARSSRTRCLLANGNSSSLGQYHLAT